VWGTGFNRGGLAGATWVWVGSDSCTVVPYYSSDNRLVCYTAPHAVAETVTVRVQLVAPGFGGTSYATCAGACAFTFNAESTPAVHAASLGGVGGALLRFSGDLKGPTTAWYQNVFVGDRDTGQRCYPSEDAQRGGLAAALLSAASPLADNLRGSDGTPVLRCEAPPVEAGRYNVSLEVRDPALGARNFGQATRGRWAKQVRPGAGVFHVTMLPRVDSVSAAVYGLAGGGTITITGAGFSSAAGGNAVSLLAGDGAGGNEWVPCAVVAASPTALTCAPAGARGSTNASAALSFSGGAGARHSAWRASLAGWGDAATAPWVARPVGGGAPAGAAVALNTDAIVGPVRNEATYNYLQLVEGFFVPPVSANYTFFARGDDPVAVFLSSDDSPRNTAAAPLAAANVNALWRSASFNKPQVFLTAGLRYYLSAQHAQGVGGDWMEVAVRVHTEGNPAAAAMFASEAQAALASVPEYQQIVVTAATVREVQTFVVAGAAAGGTFALSVGGAVGAAAVALTVPATATEVRDALRPVSAAALGCNRLGVARSPWAGVSAGRNVSGFAYAVTILCPAAAAGVFRATIAPVSLTLSPDATSPAVVLQSARTREPSAPLAGSYRLAWATNPAVRTGYIPFGAGWGAVVDALKALPDFPQADEVGFPAVETGGLGDYTDGLWHWVAMHGVGRDMPALVGITVDDAGAPTLLGDNATVTVTTIMDGSADPFLAPLPVADFIEAPAPAPTVRVVSNGLLAACAGVEGATAGAPSNCSFRYDAAATPAVSAIDPSAAAVAGGTLLISGTGFLSGARGPPSPDAPAGAPLINVLLGPPANATACNVTAVTATTIACTLPNAPAGAQAVSVEVVGRGAAAFATSALLTFALVVADVLPSSGSTAGGTRLAITGTGFGLQAADTVVMLVETANPGTKLPCTVVAGGPGAVECVTPTDGLTDGVGYTVEVNGVAWTGGGFTPKDDYTPKLVALSPAKLSAAITGRVNVTVALPYVATDVEAGAIPAGTTVTLSGRPCAVTASWDTATAGERLVSCVLTRGSPLSSAAAAAAVAPTLYMPPYGFAKAPTPLTVDTSFYITGAPLALANGSCMGGATVTIPGVGLAAKASATMVHFHLHTSTASSSDHSAALPCAVQAVAADGSSVTCVTGMPDLALGVHLGPPLEGHFVVSQNNVVAPSLAGNMTPAFAYDKRATPFVYGLTVGGAPDFPFFVNGSHLNAGGLELKFGSMAATVAGVAGDGGSAWGYLPALPCGEFELSGTSALGAVHVNATAGVSPVSAASVRVTAAGTLFYANPLLVYGLDASKSGAAGSLAGGHLLTVRGWGFSPFPVPAGSEHVTSVTVSGSALPGGSASGVLVAANTTSLTFLTPVGVSTAGGAASLTFTPEGHTAIVPPVTLAAAYTYLPAASSPTLASVSPAAAAPGASVTIAGAALGAAAPDGAFVTIGGAACAITAWADASVTCTVGEVPAGTHRVLLSLPGAGYAIGPAVVFTVAGAGVTGATGAAGGFGGGGALVLAGAGFATAASGGVNTVTLCGRPCAVTAATYTALTCTAPPAATGASLDALRVARAEALSGVPFASAAAGGALTAAAGAAAAPAFDGAPATPFSGFCRVGLDLGATSAALISRVRWYAAFQKAALAVGGKWYATAAAPATAPAASWDLLGTVGASVEGWNDLDVFGGAGQPAFTFAAQPAYRAVQFVFPAGAAGAACSAGELMAVGYPVLPAAYDAAACALNVTVAGPPNALAGQRSFASLAPTSPTFAFSLALTPRVTGVSPWYGSALGGTAVTLTGTGFGTAALGATLSLNGVPCDITSVADTAVACTTRARDAIRAPSIALTLPGRGAAVYDGATTSFRYLDRWSELTTWAFNEPPVEGDSVVVPEGQAILVDVSPPRLFLVYVAGALVFDRRDLAFNASYIVVHGGALEAGTEAEPFLHKLTITLHGDRYKSIELPDVGAKVLAVMNREPAHAPAEGSGSLGEGAAHSMMGMGHGGDARAPGLAVGSLDLHGAPRLAVWAKVAATAAAGADTITLAADVDWAAGERVVITSSSADYTEAEELTVVERVSARVIRVSPRLRFTHESRVVPAGQWGHSDVDLRCEVGLLSRNVVVQGDDDSPAQQFGCHNVAAHGGLFRYENIEVRRCGQAFNLGRYSTHMHMLGDTGATSYVRFNSIHHSFQRMTTVHATNYATVKGNFGYKIMGHSLFLEDGVERYNVLEGNLIASTERCYGCLASDVKPASFWTASPTNFWRNNVAAGCTNDGYWLELPGNPHGPSFTTAYCPVGAPLGQHFGNVAHSNGVHGLRLYPTVTPYNDPCNPDSGAAPQHFYNFTSWRNGRHGIFGKRNGALRHVNAKLVENRGDDYNQVKYVGNFNNSLGLFTETDANINNGLFIGTVDPAASPIWDKRALNIPGFEFFLVRGATFVNYGAAGAITGCNDCENDDNYRQGGYTVRFSGLSWVNTERRVTWQPPFKDIFMDLDGTLTGGSGVAGAGPGATVLPFFAFNSWPECARDGGAVFTAGHVCSAAVVVRRLQLDGVQPWVLDFKNLNVSSAAGTDVVRFRPKEAYGWVAPVVTNKAPAAAASDNKFYTLGFMQSPWLSDWQTLNLRYSEPDYVAPGEWTRLTFGFTDQRFRNRVRYQKLASREVPALPVGRLPGPGDAFGTGTTFTGSNDTASWTVGLSTGNLNGTAAPLRTWDAYAVAVANIQCPDGGCPVPPPPALGNKTRWSDPATWPRGQLPREGDTVVINSTMWVELDVSPPPLARLDVLGKLTFLDGADRALAVGSLVVWGAVEIGTPAAPFLNRAELLLTGARASPAVIVDNNIFAGNKNVVVLGSFTACGAPVGVTWTRLAATAAAGATSLSLAAPVPWVAGDLLTIAPTEWDLPMQAEEATIAGVSGDGLTLTLAAPLAHRHFSGPLVAAPATPAGAAARLGAAVGLLSRRVVIRGNVSAAPILITDPNSGAAPYLGEDSYGGHVLVAAVARPGTPPAAWRVGRVDVRYAELRNMGKAGMEHSAVVVQYGGLALDAADTPAATQALSGAAPAPANTLIGNAFSFSFNPCFQAVAAPNAVLEGNVFHRCLTNGVWLDGASTNASLTRNLVVHTRADPSINAPGQTPWVWPTAAFFLDAPTYAAVRGNVAAGSSDAGFALHPEGVCGASAAAARAAGYPPPPGELPVVAGNEAYAAVVGVFLLPTPPRAPPSGGPNRWCGTRSEGWLVAKAAHVGVLAVDGLADFALLRSVVAESHIGVSLNFVAASPAQLFSELQGVTLVGSGPATAAAATASGCPPSSICRAATSGDVTATGGACGSTLGAGYRRVGLLGAQYTNRGKTCVVDGSLPVCRPASRPHRLCAMPWEKRFGMPSTRATQLYLSNVTFAGFSGVEPVCGGGSAGARSVAYAHNPTQVDMAVPVFARRVAWDGVGEAARFSFRTTAASPASGTGAVTVGGGDGFQNILLQDDDGSLTGTPFSSVLGPNPAVGEDAPACVWKEAWQGMVCPGGTFRQAVVENMGAFAGHPRPIRISPAPPPPLMPPHPPPPFPHTRAADLDRGHRHLGQLFLGRLANTIAAKDSYGAVNLANRTALCQGMIGDSCPMRFYFGQYNFLLRPGRATHLMFSGTEPGQTRYHFFSPYATEAALLKVYHQRPNSLNVFAGAAAVAEGGAAAGVGGAPSLPWLTDAHGAWAFSPSARHATLVLRGGGPAWDAPPINVLRLASVQVTLTLSVSADAFFSGGGSERVVTNMAALLGIPSSRIKVVSVAAAEAPVRRLLQQARAASAATTATIEILPDPAAIALSSDTSFNASGAPAAGAAGAAALSAAALANTMATLGASVSNLYATGQMSTVGGFALLSAPAVLLPPVPTAGGAAPAPAPGLAPGEGGAGGGAKLSAGALAAAVVGGVVAFFTAVAMALLAYKQGGLHGHSQTRVRPNAKPLSSAVPLGEGGWSEQPPPPPPAAQRPRGALNTTLLPSLGTPGTRVFYENPAAAGLQAGRTAAARLVTQKSARLSHAPVTAARR
jgi:hypothetical protein